mmetsp:Transcript_34959/g.109297  ORF Transcript_34959/g.109297 Transcript_34959/m.109297 type:complete len:204 (-) Transcript_34959:200-811(-)
MRDPQVAREPWYLLLAPGVVLPVVRSHSRQDNLLHQHVALLQISSQSRRQASQRPSCRDVCCRPCPGGGASGTLHIHDDSSTLAHHVCDHCSAQKRRRHDGSVNGGFDFTVCELIQEVPSPLSSAVDQDVRSEALGNISNLLHHAIHLNFVRAVARVGICSPSPSPAVDRLSHLLQRRGRPRNQDDICSPRGQQQRKLPSYPC